MNITRTCPVTKVTHTRYIEGVTPEDLKALEGGACVVDLLPELSLEDREFIVTGMTSEGWDILFDLTS
jgi:hypothetical protein